jgi:hypothetical protein
LINGVGVRRGFLRGRHCLTAVVEILGNDEERRGLSYGGEGKTRIRKFRSFVKVM